MHETLSKTRRYLILFNTVLATFMATLDGSIVNISLPSIAGAFHVGIETVQWVVTGYTLTISALLLLWGRLSDRIGRKHLFAVGLGIFTLGSLLCGLSTSFPMLVASRVLQAVGASIAMTLVQAIVTAIFPPEERGKALGIIGSVVAAGSLAGPSLGALLVAAAGWPSIFFVNLPFGVLAVVLTLVQMPETATPTAEDRKPFDVRGALVLVVTIVSLFFGLLTLQDGTMPPAAAAGLIALGVLLLALFLRLEAGHADPLLDLAFFRSRGFDLSLASAYLSYLCMFGYTFFMPFYLQDVLKMSILQAGLTMSVFPVTTIVVAPLSGWFSDRRPNFPFTVVGLGLMAVGFLAIAFLGDSPSLLRIVVPVFVTGVGGALFQSPNNSRLMGSVPRPRLGVAGGVIAFFRNFGMVSGTTFGVMLFVATAGLGVDSLSGGAGFDPSRFLVGFRAVLLFASACAFVGAVLGLFLPRTAAKGGEAAPGGPAGAPAAPPALD